MRTRINSPASTASGDWGRKPMAVNANTHRIGRPTCTSPELTWMTS